MTMKKPGATPGRRPKLPPAGAAERIEALAADGFSVRGIAAGLGTSQDTLRKWMDEHAELREAFIRGRAREEDALRGMLFRSAIEDKNIVAAFFLLKCRFGWRDKDTPSAVPRAEVLEDMAREDTVILRPDEPGPGNPVT